MKKILLITIFILTQLYTLRSRAQTQINVTDYKDQTIDASGKDPLTDGMLKSNDGFTIAIKKSLGIQAVYWMNAASVPQKVDPIPHGTGVVWFVVKNSLVPAAPGTLPLRLVKDPAHPDQYKTLSLKFAAGAAPDPTAQGVDLSKIIPPLDGDCKEMKLVSTRGNYDTCAMATFDNKFGELSKNYDVDKVVYIYDFNPKTSVKEFYKVRLVNNALQVNLANFNKEHLSPNEHFQFKIVNVNKFMYEVNINHGFIDYDSKPSALFSKFFLGDTSLMGSLMSVYTSGITNNKVAQSAENDADNAQLADLLLRIRCFFENYNGFNAQMLQAYNPCSGFQCCHDFEYHKFANQLLYIRLEMALLQGKINDAKAVLAKTTTALASCTKMATDLATATKSKAALDTKAKTATLSDDDKKTQSNLTDQIAKLASQKCEDTNVAQMKVDSTTQTAKVNQYAAFSNLFTKLPNENDIKRLAIFINNMVYSNAVQVINEETIKGNRYNLFINIKSKDSLVKYLPIMPLNDTISFSLPVVFKPFISFSSGSFLALGNSLRNKTYNWQAVSKNKAVSDTSKYILAERGYSTPVLGFSALGNVEWKLNSNFGLGASGGVGLTIESSPRFSYLAGGSMFFGDKRQFVASFGIAAMQVDALDNNLLAVNQQNISYTSSNKPTVTYYKVLRTGLFISLTFTPFSTSNSK